MTDSIDQTNTPEVVAETKIPTIDELLAMTSEDAAVALQSIPEGQISTMGAQVGKQAASYKMFGGMSALVAGFAGDINAVENAAQENASRADRLADLEQLFFDEYRRRSDELQTRLAQSRK